MKRIFFMSLILYPILQTDFWKEKKSFGLTQKENLIKYWSAINMAKNQKKEEKALSSFMSKMILSFFIIKKRSESLYSRQKQMKA